MKLKAVYFSLYITIIGVCVFLLSFHAAPKNNLPQSQEVLKSLFNAVSKIKTMRYHLVIGERINGKMHYTESRVKLQIHPRKLYLSTKGPELLWVQAENDGKALVKPDAFPFVNLNLDPYGTLLRKNQHHTIHEMGIQYVADILKDGAAKAGNNFDKHFVIIGEDIYNGHPCYKLSISFPDFTWEPYTVRKDETVTSICRRLHLSEYMVLERNHKVAWYDDVKPGQVIQVPTVYAKLTLLHIDKESFLPIKNIVYDDKGLFEVYEYVDYQVNPLILPEEFTKEYKDYHF